MKYWVFHKMLTTFVLPYFHWQVDSRKLVQQTKMIQKCHAVLNVDNQNILLQLSHTISNARLRKFGVVTLFWDNFCSSAYHKDTFVHTASSDYSPSFSVSSC